MTEVDLVVLADRVVTGDGVAPRAILVGGGRVVRVGPKEDERLAPPSAVRVRVGDDAVVLPGVVDTHVHINEPGRTAWEGFETATAAAAAGGVTTLVDMPLNCIPPTTSVLAMFAKVAAMEGKLHVDVGLWGGAVPGNDRVLRAMLDEGALGFKAFMVDSGVDEFPCVSADDLERALRALAGTNAPLLAHAELPGPIEAAAASLDAFKDPRAYARYLASRPMSAEDEAVALLAKLVRETGSRAHVVHLSSSGALATLERAREEGLALSAETAPHYLSFEAESIPSGATEFKCAPPIRNHENRERLWGGLGAGLVDMVVTDHSPCTPELKRRDTGAFAEAWGGIASLQFGLSAVWTEARRRGFDLSRVVRWMCEGPAALAGVLGRKGRLREGYDADFVVFRPDAAFEVTPALVRHRHTVTPYAGRQLHGVVVATYLRGVRIHGEPESDGRHRGEWLRRRNG